jgi:hypothetical protein
MDVIRHHDVGANVSAATFCQGGELAKRVVNVDRCKNRAALERARCHEIYRRCIEDSFETIETFSAHLVVLGIGGHRPPLQDRFPQLLQQLPMDPIEPAVAEDGHHVLRFQQRHELLYNMSGVRLVKRRPA